MNAFSARLHSLRARHGISQAVLADGLHYTRETISLWERGRKLPSFDALIGICQYFDVSADWLLGISCREEGNEVV